TVGGGGGTGGMAPAQVGRYGPGMLVLYCAINLFFATSFQALYFSPAEVNFLFAGPFTRRQLLAYKIVLTLLVGLPALLLMTAAFRIRGAWFFASFLALFEIYVFIQLFGMVLSLLVVSFGARLYSPARQLLVA